MTANLAKIVPYEGKQAAEAHAVDTITQTEQKARSVQVEDYNFEELAATGFLQNHAQRRLKAIRAELSELKAQNRWEDVVLLYHPLEQKEPEIVRCGMDLELRAELAFALCQLQRFEDAITQYKKCLEQAPNDFRLHSGMGFTLYNSLLAAKQKKVLLTPQEKKERITKANFHFKRAQELRPDSVTAYYRHGMLYKEVTSDQKKAIPLLEKAKSNWEQLSTEDKQKRHQEFKNYVKAMYSLASCYLSQNMPKNALEILSKCIQEDSEKNYISPQFKSFLMGKILFHLGKLNDTLETLTIALSQAKEDELDFILELKARTHLALGEYEEGLKAIGAIPKHKKRHYVIWTEADILTAMGKREEAKLLLEKSAERDRRSKHKALIRLAKICFLQEEYENSVGYAEAAVKFHYETYGTPDSEGLFWIAAAYIRLGDLKNAEKYMKELSDFNPYYPRLEALRRAIAKL